MEKVLVCSLKGGVGKTKVTAELAKALHRKGYRVGAVDCDYHAPNLHVEFGCEGTKLSRGKGDALVPPQVNGIKILSWGMIWPPTSAVMIDDTQIGADDLERAVDLIQASKYAEAVKWLQLLIEHPAGALEHMKLLLEEGAIDWGDTQYLVIDTPPEATGVIRAALEVKGLKGAIIVCHPSRVSLADTRRTVDMFRKRELPLLGILSNQGVQNGVKRFDLTDQDIARFAAESNIPFIASVPHAENLKPYFDAIANYVISAEPVILKVKHLEEKDWKPVYDSLKKLAGLLNSLKRKE